MITLEWVFILSFELALHAFFQFNWASLCYKDQNGRIFSQSMFLGEANFDFLHLSLNLYSILGAVHVRSISSLVFGSAQVALQFL